MKTKIGIAGATGYTGIQLVALLLQHPHVEITLLTSEKSAGQAWDKVFPMFQGRLSTILEPMDTADFSAKCDLVFSCLPHMSAMKTVAKLIQQGLKVIDLSADFRLQAADIYEAWYGSKHVETDLLQKAVYGIPELHRAKIQSAQLVANPGCYPTTSILGLAPLLKNDLIERNSIIIDAKSGTSGAGRSATVDNIFCEVHESLHAYKVAKHRHTPEVEQEISLLAGEAITVQFTPHLIPMDRGIYATIYANLKKKQTTQELLKHFHDFYRNEPFIQVMPEGVSPKTKEVRGSNRCHLGVTSDPRTGRVIVLATLDNLMKGASSQAIQNMNLVCGFPETTGLEGLALFP